MIIIMTANFMTRRKLEEKNIRKIMKSGNSYVVGIPLEYFEDLGWRKRQKVVVRKRGKEIVIRDWKK